ncbi:hypothetical protein [Alicyclobacillus dauci]|uniref:YibE/F-like protein n=1 Tax=Alicyclobacillus dauci TaxID=1475485 RepID=A0ABY6Z727_9BACL|nr:hypothetical protein [Alicyclobacillus dauci]WAH38697.1 hypothetical protein NZD86_09545 [Alicyclobacillus dauci]
MLLFLTLPIALIDTILLYQLMSRREINRADSATRQQMLNSSLMRFSFAVQLVIELTTGNKTVGCITSFIFGILAGLLTTADVNLNVMAEILMNVFMGISMGVFLIGHLSLLLTVLLIAPILLSSTLTFLHTRKQLRRK